MKIVTVLLVSALCAIAPASSAATLHVAKDGSGDFTVIQDAVDAASPGDTVWIHAGRYTEMTEDHDVWGNGLFFSDVHVVVDKDNLTLKGDGAEDTIIGPVEFPANPAEYYHGILVSSDEVSRLSIEDIRVDNSKGGVFAASGAFSATRCQFTGFADYGVRLFTSNGAGIHGCYFEGSWQGILSTPPSANPVISECEFVETNIAMVFVATPGIEIHGCSTIACYSGISVQQGSTAIVENCEMLELQGTGVYVSLGGGAQMSGCTIMGGQAGIWVTDGGAGSVFAEECTISGSTYTNLWVQGSMEVHDSTIINGGQWSVLCYSSSDEDCRVDLTGNYWGTDSETQIAEWIMDSNDDPDYCCTVDFIPFEGSVATEPRSWSSVKEMFQGGSDQ